MLVQFALDSWMYIVFGIAWIAFTIYKGANKSKPQTQENPSSPKKPSFLESLMDEFDTEKTQQNTPPVDYEPNNDPDDWIPSSDKKEPEVATQEYVPKKEGISSTITDEPITSPDKKPQRKSTKVNLRKAIIYTEILHRPYE